MFFSLDNRKVFTIGSNRDVREYFIETSKKMDRKLAKDWGDLNDTNMFNVVSQIVHSGESYLDEKTKKKKRKKSDFRDKMFWPSYD